MTKSAQPGACAAPGGFVQLDLSQTLRRSVIDN